MATSPLRDSVTALLTAAANGSDLLRKDAISGVLAATCGLVLVAQHRYLAQFNEKPQHAPAKKRDVSGAPTPKNAAGKAGGVQIAAVAGASVTAASPTGVSHRAGSAGTSSPLPELSSDAIAGAARHRLAVGVESPDECRDGTVGTGGPVASASRPSTAVDATRVDGATMPPRRPSHAERLAEEHHREQMIVDDALAAVVPQQQVAAAPGADAATHNPDDLSVIDATKFWPHFRLVVSLAVTGWRSREVAGSLAFMMLFAAKAALSMARAKADGALVESFVRGDHHNGALLHFVAVSLGLATTSGMIQHLRFWLIAQYRAALTNYFHRAFFRGLTFYRALIIDDKLQPGTSIACYCHEFAEHFAELPYYFVLPALEAGAALFFLAREAGLAAAAAVSAMTVVSLVVLRSTAPPFGAIHARLVAREERFRLAHTDVRGHAEQLALHRGGGYMRAKLDALASRVFTGLRQMAAAKGHFAALQGAMSLGAWDVMALAACVPLTRSGLPRETILRNLMVQRGIIRSFHENVERLIENLKEASHLYEFTEQLSSFHALIRRARQTMPKFPGGHRRSPAPINVSVCAQSLLGGSQTAPGCVTPLLPSMPAVAPPSACAGQPAFSADYDSDSFGAADDALPGPADSLQLPGGAPMSPTGTTPLTSPTTGSVHLTTGRRFGPVATSVGIAPTGCVSTADDLLTDEQKVVLEGVTIRTPAGVELVRDLTLEINEGASWVILGPNGCGKTSILRVIAGLWAPVCGVARVTPRAELTFLPQSAFLLSSATLFEQLAFPEVLQQGGQRARATTADLLYARRSMVSAFATAIVELLGGWKSPACGFGEEADYSYPWDSLSGGQQQMIAVARLFFRAQAIGAQGIKCFALLDESTSQIDEDREEGIFRNLRDAGITYASVSHSQRVIAHHESALLIQPGGKFRVTKVRKDQPARTDSDALLVNW